jgi:hypothetical protein
LKGGRAGRVGPLVAAATAARRGRPRCGESADGASSQGPRPSSKAKRKRAAAATEGGSGPLVLRGSLARRPDADCRPACRLGVRGGSSTAAVPPAHQEIQHVAAGDVHVVLLSAGPYLRDRWARSKVLIRYGAEGCTAGSAECGEALWDSRAAAACQQSSTGASRPPQQLHTCACRQPPGGSAPSPPPACPAE